VDPYSATSAAIAALYGTLHGGRQRRVLQLLKEIGSFKKFRIHQAASKAGEVQNSWASVIAS